ncbi:collagen alpha-1(III) chain-like [Daphnia pulicaria]|uniref:collagen alpha-1(III) chain-like n=1 Tax=Daphnia pulicaria TaxID=35523 RepID=UPI001EEBA9A1|nr:collagen alpha-1(III) chain-like [Daphnia pulicaria]
MPLTPDIQSRAIIHFRVSQQPSSTVKLTLKGVVEKLESKVIQLEDKVIGLEVQLKENNEIKETLQSDVNQLKAKLNQQEYFETSLQNNRPSPTAGKPGKSSTPRTCLELRSTNPVLSSGIHWIDPDGDGGDSPITVYCNMTTGSTVILHDSESPMDVGHCADPGCYSRVIKYNATYGQMKALADLSARCQQSIKYDCFLRSTRA